MVLNTDKADSWSWALSNNGCFNCKSLSGFIDSKLLNNTAVLAGTMRNNLVPKKVEVFIWRVRKGRIPVLAELDKRGIDLHSVRCPLCDNDIEGINHSLLNCERVWEIWLRVFDWWGVTRPTVVGLNDILEGNVGSFGKDPGKDIWQAALWTSVYLIWKNRNEKVFKNKCWSAPVALSEIQVKGFEWIAKRCKRKVIDWHSWFQNPYSLTV
ncbi:uncharacterized protein [Rutidosis leptorrhynchoides]|uniref:uncharacterized protein n=1 Tax=Rutidosis leptorrhynchoides TaxID=125765 RepID=UPI003A9A570E